MDKPAQVEATGQIFDRSLLTIKHRGVDVEVRRHPDILTMPHIESWVKKYEYTKEYKIPTPFDELHPCHIDLRDEYEILLVEMEKKWRTLKR